MLNGKSEKRLSPLCKPLYFIASLNKKFCKITIKKSNRRHKGYACYSTLVILTTNEET